MEYEVVYEISKHPFPYPTVITGAIAIVSLIFCLECIFSCREKKDYGCFDIVKIAGTLGLNIPGGGSRLSGGC